MSRILYLKQCSAELTNLLSNLLWAHASEHMTSNQMFKLNHMDDVQNATSYVNEQKQPKDACVRHTGDYDMSTNAKCTYKYFTLNIFWPRTRNTEAMSNCLIHSLCRQKQTINTCWRDLHASNKTIHSQWVFFGNMVVFVQRLT